MISLFIPCRYDHQWVTPGSLASSFGGNLASQLYHWSQKKADPAQEGGCMNWGRVINNEAWPTLFLVNYFHGLSMCFIRYQCLTWASASSGPHRNPMFCFLSRPFHPYFVMKDAIDISFANPGKNVKAWYQPNDIHTPIFIVKFNKPFQWKDDNPYGRGRVGMASGHPVVSVTSEEAE